ncbi:MAG: ATP-binding cassette domain-containing protein [Candidatus Methanomethylicaceae archaeon]|nr:ATP-binding cassette domain-containing protein [Candidatus Verstraetearchaeota archaeon]
MLLCENIVKVFQNGVKALDSISLELKRGEILGILGESGAGKTTLLRILRGVESFNNGRILFEDLEITPNSPKEVFYELQKRTAIQLQRTFSLWPDSVIDNVIRALRYQDIREETLPQSEGEYEEYKIKALEILKIVGLDGKADLWSMILSGGEKQRLILARQIARKPKILLLDEPGTMTDVKSREDLINALKKVREAYNTSILFVSHNPQTHLKLADRAILIEKGRKIMEGKTEDVINEFLSKLEKPLEKTIIKGKEILKMENVNKIYKIIPYGKIFELKNANLTFRTGEITAIIGPSAAGKTVLLRMLAGLEMPNSGNIMLYHKGEWIILNKLCKKSLRARRKISIMHQEFDLPYWSEVLSLFSSRLGIKDYKLLERAIKKAEKMGLSEIHIDFLSRIMDLPENELEIKLNELEIDRNFLKEIFKEKNLEKSKEIAEKILSWFNINPEILNRKSYELSGGEKIRIALALAIASNPKVLLLDEPFGDLDPLNLRRVANILKRIKLLFKPAIILVSHQLDFVEEVADRCILIINGKILSDGNPSMVIKEYMRVKENGI